MTRWFLLGLVLSVAVAWSDLAGLAPWAFAGAAVALGGLALKLHRHAQRQQDKRTLEGLRALTAAEFEAEVARWLRRDGWQVEARGGTGDGGIDLVATKHDQTLAVQCKRYADTTAVAAAQVRDLYGAAAAIGATGAILVTTGRVTAPARAWAEALPEGTQLAFHDRECVGQLALGRAGLG